MARNHYEIIGNVYKVYPESIWYRIHKEFPTCIDLCDKIVCVCGEMEWYVLYRTEKFVFYKVHIA